MRYDTVLFDLDGTLIDTKPGVLRSARTVTAMLGVPVPEEKQLVKFLGPPLHVCFTDVIGMSPELADKAIPLFRRDLIESGNAFDCEPFPGIPELLSKLKSAGIKLGVATSKVTPLAIKVLGKNGLLDYFLTVSGSPADDPSFTKSDSVRGAVDNIPGAEYPRTVLVGDRHYDAQGAAGAGVDSIGVLYGYGAREEILSGGFTHIFRSVGDLTDFLCGKG